MGLEPSRIYLDSCIAIYLVEEHRELAFRIESLLENQPDARLFVSDLTVMECLIGPFRSNNKRLEEKYKEWFEGVTVLGLNSTVFVEAAQLRSVHQTLKTPDALHIAAALRYNCDGFWPNDTRLSNVAPSIVRNIL